jgi:hypothetical protein
MRVCIGTPAFFFGISRKEFGLIWKIGMSCGIFISWIWAWLILNKLIKGLSQMTKLKFI